MQNQLINCRHNSLFFFFWPATHFHYPNSKLKIIIVLPEWMWIFTTNFCTIFSIALLMSTNGFVNINNISIRYYPYAAKQIFPVELNYNKKKTLWRLIYSNSLCWLFITDILHTFISNAIITTNQIEFRHRFTMFLLSFLLFVHCINISVYRSEFMCFEVAVLISWNSSSVFNVLFERHFFGFTMNDDPISKAQIFWLCRNDFFSLLKHTKIYIFIKGIWNLFFFALRLTKTNRFFFTLSRFEFTQWIIFRLC